MCSSVGVTRQSPNEVNAAIALSPERARLALGVSIGRAEDNG